MRAPLREPLVAALLWRLPATLITVAALAVLSLSLRLHRQIGKEQAMQCSRIGWTRRSRALRTEVCRTHQSQRITTTVLGWVSALRASPSARHRPAQCQPWVRATSSFWVCLLAFQGIMVLAWVA